MEERAGFHGYLKRTWEAAQAALGTAWEYTPKGFGYAPLVEEAVKQEVEQEEAEESKLPPAKKRRLLDTTAPNTPSADARPLSFKPPAQSDITLGETNVSTFTEDTSELRSPESRRRTKPRRLTKPHASQEEAVATARELVRNLGGTFVEQLGIDLAEGSPEAIDKWFLWALLFNHRISANIVVKTHQVLADAGLLRPQDAAGFEQEQLAELLQQGGYTHYMQQTAARLKRAAEQLREGPHRTVADLRGVDDPRALEREVEKLHGAGRSTAILFLRELRGIWPGAQPDFDDRVVRAAAHLGLLDFVEEASKKKTNLSEPGGEQAAQLLGSPHPLEELAEKAGVEIRDLEAALVRISLVHSHQYKSCVGGSMCEGLAGVESGNIVVGSSSKKKGLKGEDKKAR